MLWIGHIWPIPSRLDKVPITTDSGSVDQIDAIIIIVHHHLLATELYKLLNGQLMVPPFTSIQVGIGIGLQLIIIVIIN